MISKFNNRRQKAMNVPTIAWDDGCRWTYNVGPAGTLPRCPN